MDAVMEKLPDPQQPQQTTLRMSSVVHWTLDVAKSHMLDLHIDRCRLLLYR